MIQLKNRPFAGKVFSDVGGVTSCAVLVRFPTLTILLVEEESELVEVIAAASKSGYSFAKKKAGLLISAAQKAQTLGIIWYTKNLNLASFTALVLYLV